VPIVRLKTLENNRKINELLSRFTLPSVSTKGYDSMPRPELTGGSAVNGTIRKNDYPLLAQRKKVKQKRKLPYINGLLK
jgi:hypothetical protein